MRAAIESRVQGVVDDLMVSPMRRDVLAVVVSGSAAREEERWMDGQLQSDIDVMVISRSSPLRLDRSRATQRILAAHAYDNVEGGRIPEATLRYATLANYEARHRGVVVHGDSAVLKSIPMERPSDIPAWEAARLVANRLFEHLKHRAGLTSGEAAVIKSYEAIGESQLVLEHRYRPSFRERAEEMSRTPLASPVAGAQDLFVAAEESRRGGTPRLDSTPSRAINDLKLQLHNALQQLNIEGNTLEDQFVGLSRREFHLTHRVYWTLRGLSRRDRRHRPDVDPILQLWRAAIAGLAGKITENESLELVRLWQECPQILKKGVSP